MCDIETSKTGREMPDLGCSTKEKNISKLYTLALSVKIYWRLGRAVGEKSAR
jgi:hypothetical protein